MKTEKVHSGMYQGVAWITRAPELLGFIPEFLNAADPDGAVEQLHKNYGHGGGWNKFEGFTLKYDDTPLGATIKYPGDPVYREVARGALVRAEAAVAIEEVIVFQGAWVCVRNFATGDYQIARMD